MSAAGSCAALLRRWLKFNAVGAAGIGVQAAALAVLISGLGVPYAPATLLAVECAVLHNFFCYVLGSSIGRVIAPKSSEE